MTASITAADLAVRGAGSPARRSASDGGSAFQSALDAQPAVPHQDEVARSATRSGSNRVRSA